MAETTKVYTRKDGVELKEHLECRLAALREYMDARLCAIENATTLARQAMELRLNNLNELRDALSDLSALMATRTEVGIMIDKLTADINELKAYKNQMEGKASQASVMIALLISVAGLVITVVRWMTGG